MTSDLGPISLIRNYLIDDDSPSDGAASGLGGQNQTLDHVEATNTPDVKIEDIQTSPGSSTLLLQRSASVSLDPPASGLTPSIYGKFPQYPVTPGATDSYALGDSASGLVQEQGGRAIGHDLPPINTSNLPIPTLREMLPASSAT